MEGKVSSATCVSRNVTSNVQNPGVSHAYPVGAKECPIHILHILAAYFGAKSSSATSTYSMETKERFPPYSTVLDYPWVLVPQTSASLTHKPMGPGEVPFHILQLWNHSCQCHKTRHDIHSSWGTWRRTLPYPVTPDLWLPEPQFSILPKIGCRIWG
jgi:hypothetical protein